MYLDRPTNNILKRYTQLHACSASKAVRDLLYRWAAGHAGDGQ